MADDMEDLQWWQDRVKRLERQLAEVHDLLAMHRRHELIPQVDCACPSCSVHIKLAEAQTQITYEQERNRNNVGMADEEMGRLKANLERARETHRVIAREAAWSIYEKGWESGMVSSWWERIGEAVDAAFAALDAVKEG